MALTFHIICQEHTLTVSCTITMYKRPVEKLLEESGCSQIDQIILCGGGMKVPKVRSELISMFPNAKILTGVNEDELLAIGCAKQASTINRQFDTHQELIDMGIDILQTGMCRIAVMISLMSIIVLLEV